MGAELEHTWVDKIRPHDPTLPRAQPQNLVGLSDPFPPLLTAFVFQLFAIRATSVQAFALPDDFARASLRPSIRIKRAGSRDLEDGLRSPDVGEESDVSRVARAHMHWRQFVLSARRYCFGLEP